MTNRAAAIRYARALLDVSVKEADPQQVEQDLTGFGNLLASHATLEKLLASPAVPTPRKRAVVAEIVDRAGAVTPVVARLLLLLAERDRLVILPELVEAYRERLMDQLQVVRAQVTTAAPLPPDRAAAIERGLAEATGRQVSVVMRVEPAIIGGVVTQIGSTVYDGSITRHLERLKEKLVEET